MVDEILVPVDGSEPSDAALTFAFERFPDAHFVALTVVVPTEVWYGAMDADPAAFEEFRETGEQEAEAVLDDARARAEEAGVTLSTDLTFGQPARSIVSYAEEHDPDQIVMGSHGRDGVSRVLLGSVAETVVRRSTVPVTVVR